MTVLINGQGYFGRFIVPAGATGDVDHLRQTIREAGWTLPDPGHMNLPAANGTTVDGSDFYRLNTSIGGSPVWVWPMCSVTETRCDDPRLAGGSKMQGYVCPVPWPLGSGCRPIDLYGKNAADTIPIPVMSPQFALIPNTVPFRPRKDDQNTPYAHASDDEPYPGYLSDYDRTVWLVSKWDGPTGDYDLNYYRHIVSDIYAQAICYDLWDETGMQVHGPEFVTPELGTPVRLEPSPSANFSPAAFAHGMEEEKKATTGLMWIGLALAVALGGVIYYNRQDAKAELAKANPVHDGKFLLNDEDPVDFDEFYEANKDGLAPEDFEDILNLKPGETYYGGGGAWADWSIKRVA